VTQVERPPRKPRLKVDPDEDNDGKDSANDSKNETPRSSKLGRIFSRQYTPTIPKTGSERGVVQSPKGIAPKLASHDEEAMPHDEESGEADDDGKTVWQTIRKVFSSSTKDLGSPTAAPVEERVKSEDCLLGENKTGKSHCLVLDLDETLVHSSFKPVGKCDFVLSINMDGVVHKVYVLKRPGVDEFLEEMAKHFELVVFTASLDKYANPLLDLLDPKGLITGRLFREHCSRRGQMYIKDLDRLGRDLESSLIIDNSPHSYALHPFHAVPIISWFDDPRDTELPDMVAFLTDLTKIPDVSAVLDASRPWRASHRTLQRIIGDNQG